MSIQDASLVMSNISKSMPGKPAFGWELLTIAKSQATKLRPKWPSCRGSGNGTMELLLAPPYVVLETQWLFSVLGHPWASVNTTISKRLCLRC